MNNFIRKNRLKIDILVVLILLLGSGCTKQKEQVNELPLIHHKLAAVSFGSSLNAVRRGNRIMVSTDSLGPCILSVKFHEKLPPDTVTIRFPDSLWSLLEKEVNQNIPEMRSNEELISMSSGCKSESSKHFSVVDNNGKALLSHHWECGIGIDEYSLYIRRIKELVNSIILSEQAK